MVAVVLLPATYSTQVFKSAHILKIFKNFLMTVLLEYLDCASFTYLCLSP